MNREGHVYAGSSHYYSITLVVVKSCATGHICVVIDPGTFEHFSPGHVYEEYEDIFERYLKSGRMERVA